MPHKIADIIDIFLSNLKSDRTHNGSKKFIVESVV
jgi:hypothetical protein